MREDETSRLESVGALLSLLSSYSSSSSPATKHARLPLSHWGVNLDVRRTLTVWQRQQWLWRSIVSSSPRILAMLFLHQETRHRPLLLLLLAVPIPLALWLLPSSRSSSRNSTEGSGNSWFPPRLELRLWEVGSRAAG